DREEKNNILLNGIRDKIDKNHLGIDKDATLRGLRGVFSSSYKIFSLTDQEILDEMHTIQSYFPIQNRKHLLQKMEEKHWYVSYLSQRYHNIQKLMELDTPPSNDNGYTIVYKDIKDFPKPNPISKEYNALSARLNAKNVTPTIIDDLVDKGAEVNYQPQGSDWPLVFHYAISKSPQTTANMKTIIKRGAFIHNIEDQQSTTPLTIVLQRDQWLDDDFTNMIQMLIPYENPTVTLYEETKNNRTRVVYSQEKNIREFLISHSFHYPNPTTIKLLLGLKLITANRGMKDFAHYANPNQKALELLLAYGANNAGELLPQIIDKAFPHFEGDTFASNRYITFLKQLCAAKAFDKVTQKDLERMLAIQNDINEIVSYLKYISQ
ncbi:MAG TPA: hypothetical protein VHX42_00420, partial [Candidatus Babeliales bacterium]|nr:hypothetical protein [Candidatus Babeliales bacterium]